MDHKHLINPPECSFCLPLYIIFYLIIEREKSNFPKRSTRSKYKETRINIQNAFGTMILWKTKRKTHNLVSKSILPNLNKSKTLINSKLYDQTNLSSTNNEQILIIYKVLKKGAKVRQRDPKKETKFLIPQHKIALNTPIINHKETDLQNSPKL